MRITECWMCDCYDPDAEGCTMPSVDMSYACPMEERDMIEDGIDDYYDGGMNNVRDNEL